MIVLLSGTKPGHFEIPATLGAGAKREAYRARDTRLPRKVAIGVRPTSWTSSPEVRTRFEREAKMVSTPGPPHICAYSAPPVEGRRSTRKTAMTAPNSTPSTTISKTPSRTLGISRRWIAQSTILLVLATVLLAPPTVAAAGVREDHPNLVGGELLGRGLVLTLNYERFLNNHFGLGGGVMAIGTSEGVIGIMPLYASFLTGDVHSLYLSAGGAFLGGGGSVHDYESTWIMQGSIGYQYQSRGGFFLRPLFTFNQATAGSGGGFLIWPGMTIGGSF